MTIPAQEALARLKEGNQRFVTGVRSLDALLSHTRRAELATEQHPFAIVLGCSDSRVPAEVVLGHTQCGAITATLEEVRSDTSPSPNLKSIVDRVRPSVETLLAAGLTADSPDIVRQAVRANVRASADHLRHGSALLERLIRD